MAETRTAILEEKRQVAWRAVKRFREMVPQFESFARAATGRRLSVIPAGGTSGSATDGNLIRIAVPYELGLDIPHEPSKCDRINSFGVQLCKACSIREDILVKVYHEISHNAFGTFEGYGRDVNWAETAKYGFPVHTSRYDIFNNGLYLVAQKLDPNLQYLMNVFEDVRVDAAMYKVRPGLQRMALLSERRMIEGKYIRPDGEIMVLGDHPLDTQAVTAVLIRCKYGYLPGNIFDPQINAFILDPQIDEYCNESVTTTKATQTFLLACKTLHRMRELGYLHTEETFTPPPPPEEEPEEDGTSEKEEDPESDESSGEPSDESGGDSGSDGGADRDEMGAPESGEDESGDSGDPGSDGLDEERVPSGDDEGSPGESEDGEEGSEGGDDMADSSADPDGEAGEDASDTGGRGDSTGGASSHSSEESPGTESSGDAEGEQPISDDLHSDDESGDPETSSGDESDGDADSSEGLPEGGDGSDGIDSGQPGGSGGEPEDSGSTGNPASDGSSEDSPGESDGEADGPDGDEKGGPGDSEPGDRDPQRSAGDSGDDVASPSDWDKNPGVLDDPRTDGPPDPTAPHHPDPDGPPADDTRPATGTSDRPMPPQNWDEYHDKHGDRLAIEEALKDLTGHDDLDVQQSDGKPAPRSELEKNLVLIAAKQEEHFDDLSKGVLGVTEVKPTDKNSWSTEFSSMASEHNQERQAQRLEETKISPALLNAATMRMRKVLQDNKRSHYDRNRRTGRVNARALGRRAPLGDDRLFQKRDVPKKKDYAAVIGVDVSGSTWGGGTLRTELMAVEAQAEYLNRIGIPFAIVAHSGIDPRGSYEFLAFRVKEFEEPWNKKALDKLHRLYPVAANLDGHAMEYLRKIVERHPATDKLIMYYSDGGMPAENGPEELRILRRELKYCKDHRIAVAAVGIGSTAPARHGIPMVLFEEHSDILAVVDHVATSLTMK